MVGPATPGKRTRREDHALLIVRDEFRTGYSLIGLLASIARLRFTGTVRIALDRRPGKELSSNGNGVFSPCLTNGVHPIYPCSSAFICGPSRTPSKAEPITASVRFVANPCALLEKDAGKLIAKARWKSRCAEG